MKINIMKDSKSSFNGKIKEIQGIYVDNFENVCDNRVRAFFLSHCHTDHMVGLFSERLYKLLETLQDVFIYTTELTFSIIKYDNEIKGVRLMPYVKVLKEGSALITLPKKDTVHEECMTVTLIPAGHCAGATMFLFRHSSKTIIYTGDFRINISDLPKYQGLLDNGKIVPIDKMYVDTTFIGEQYENFPKRSESVENLIFELKKWLKVCENAVSIWTSARYGYEYIFNKIHEALHMKVYVDERWTFYKHIQNLVPGVTNDVSSRIHLCKHRSGNTHFKCGNKPFKNYLHIYCSAMKWERQNVNFKSVLYRTPTRLDVCFATHCSRSELLYFMKYLSPKHVDGFPNKISNCLDNEVKRRKLDQDTLKLLFHN